MTGTDNPHTRGTVLVLTCAEDATADAVIAELDRRATRVVRCDLGDFPTRVRLAARNDLSRWVGRLWSDDVAVDLGDVGAVYYRRPTQFRFPDGLSDGDRVFATMEARHGLGGVLASLPALWVNAPAQVAAAEYKPRQLQIAERVGLTVPRTLITNDHDAAQRFVATLGGAQLVCKTLSSVLLADDDGLKMTFTTPVDPTTMDPDHVAVTTNLLQEWVPKAFEVRVTMVGARPLAVAIHTESERGRVDWRADYEALRYERIDVPSSVARGLVAYLRAFGLNFGAFDVVVTPEGQWVMLECNPAGQWLWLEQETGVPIAAAMADLLTGSGVPVTTDACGMGAP